MVFLADKGEFRIIDTGFCIWVADEHTQSGGESLNRGCCVLSMSHQR